MTEGRYKRKLSAILFADVQEYSRLMGEDEDGTVRMLKDHLKTVADLVERFRGRLVDTTGDNFLAEFGSVVDAVRCALRIQEEIRKRNEAFPEDRRMAFRMGINLGDVIEEDGRIYGDGVNTAARIQQLVEGGGICISGTAYDQVKNRLPLGFEFLGEHPVKNIPDPVRTYRVLPASQTPGIRRKGERKSLLGSRTIRITLLGAFVIAAGAMLWTTDWRGPAATGRSTPERPAGLPIPDEPSIAVLPFENLSGDPEQEYLSRGFTDDLITSLSYLPRIFVIARSSTATYAGKPADVRDISRDLGVRYVLEGSIQRTETRLRINAQLVDGTTGRHVWAERYDRNMGNLFGIEEAIILEIATAISGKLTDGEVSTAFRRQTENLPTWEALQRARSVYERYSVGENLRARELFRKLVEKEPTYLPAKAYLGWTYYQEGKWTKGEERNRAFQKAEEIGEELVRSSPPYADGYMLLSFVQSKQGKHEESIVNGRKCLELRPNYDIAAAGLAAQLNFAGEPEEAIDLMRRAIRWNPYHKPWYLHTLGLSYHLAGRHAEAIEVLKQAAGKEEGTTDSIFPHVRLTAVYADLGRDAEMRAEAAEVLRIDPKFSAAQWMKIERFQDPKTAERRKGLLLKAGLPE